MKISRVIVIFIGLMQSSIVCFCSKPNVRQVLEVGVATETFGVVLSEEGHIFVPIALYMPNVSITAKAAPSCNLSAKIPSNIASSLDTGMKNYITPYKSQLFGLSGFANVETTHSKIRRTKRFVPIIAGLLGIGSSIWNRVSITSLQSSLSTLRSHVSDNSHKINLLKEGMTMIGDTQDTIIHHLTKLESHLTRLEKTILCNEFYDDVVKSYLLDYAIFAPMEFLQAADTAMQGRVSTSLLPLKVFQKISKSLITLKYTAYPIFPSLAYEIGRFFLDEIRISPFLVTGVLILPKILPHHLGELVHIGTVPFWSNTSYMRLDLPSTAVVDSERKVVWVPDPLECTSTPGVLICPKSSKHQDRNICLEELLFHNSTQKCQVYVRGGLDPTHESVIQMRSGVLVGADVRECNVLRISDGREITVTKHKNTNKQSRLLTSAIGDYVAYMDEHFSLISSREDYTYQNIIIDHPPISVPVDTLDQLNPGEWKSQVKLLENTGLRLDGVTTQSVLLGIGCACLILIITLGIVVCWIRKKWIGTRTVQQGLIKVIGVSKADLKTWGKTCTPQDSVALEPSSCTEFSGLH